MRLVDANALKNRLHEALEFQESIDNYEGAELFEIAKDIADEQPTIDAIPVEWLRSKKVKTYNWYKWWTIDGLIEVWQKEQGAR